MHCCQTAAHSLSFPPLQLPGAWKSAKSPLQMCFFFYLSKGSAGVGGAQDGDGQPGSTWHFRCDAGKNTVLVWTPNGFFSLLLFQFIAKVAADDVSLWDLCSHPINHQFTHKLSGLQPWRQFITGGWGVMVGGALAGGDSAPAAAYRE